MAKGKIPADLLEKHYQVMKEIYESVWPKLFSKEMNHDDLASELLKNIKRAADEFIIQKDAELKKILMDI